MARLHSIPELLVRHAKERGQKVAFSAPGRAIIYSDLEKRTRRIATNLARAGIGRGQFVAIVLGRCLEAVESVLATTRAGAVAVPLDPRSPPAELSNILDHSGAGVVITDDRHLDQVRAAIGGGDGGPVIILVATPDSLVAEEEPQIIRYQDWAEHEECATSDIDIDDDLGAEEAFLHYTSGTTSSPKGVLSSQESWLWSANSFASAFGMTAEDQLFWPLPLFHCLGHALCIIATVAVGASAYLPDPNETLFDSLFAKQALTTTIIVGAPASYHELVASAPTLSASLALPGLRACMVAGSSAPASLSAQVYDLFGVPLLNNYGCTEACGAIATNKPGDLFREDSIGTLVPGMEVRLMGLNGNEVEDGEQGEIWVRSPGLMLKYYKETRSPFTAEGWFPTGDIACRSKTGTDLNLIGRTKELIVRGGENIQPSELERVLLRCPGVADVVVAGTSHRLLGETPAAFIVRKCSDSAHGEEETADLDPSSLLATCPFYEIDAVPRTLLGKPRRAAAFALLGLTSLAGVVLRDRLSNLTGLDLPTTLVFDYPTPEAASAYIYDRLFEPEKSQPKLPPVEAPSVVDNGDEPIAVVSMACRYPGGITSPEDLWRIVSDEVDATSGFPDDWQRGWDLETLYNPDPDHPGTSTTRRGGFLENMADFDAGLFGMSPKEALATDPQQRLLLETTWELMERGGIAPSSLHGSQTGVFVGIMYGDYGDNGKDNHELEAHIGLGSSGSVVSGRISYCFGLHGPSICIHTGCSSSLVAIHLAATSLRAGESSLAIAGGVTTMATPQSFISFSKRRGLSADGRCRAYSSDADGTGWSEGVGLVLLERLGDARRNGHRVLALVRGSAVNSDGASNGLTAPSGPAQQQVVQKALAQAALLPADVDVLEGHGTATPLGDPVEVQALISAYGNGGNAVHRPASRPLLLGSIKSNIGHTQAAAGVAGIIKMVQAIRHGIAPASLHIKEPSRQIKWEGSGVELLTKSKPWPAFPSGNNTIQRPRRAAVSSFGIGGTNAHVILEQPVGYEKTHPRGFSGQSKPSRALEKKSWKFPWLLSGADETALRAQARALLAGNALHDHDPTDIAFSLATTRSALRSRAVVNPHQGDNYQAALKALAQDQGHPEVVTGLSSGHASTINPRLACLFSGQGSRLPGKEALEELRACFPVFSEAWWAACDELDRHLECPLNITLTNDESDGSSRHIDRTDFAQAALFAFEVAMSRLLESFNIRPDFVAGHSLGEIASAHVSGALSLREAATILTARGKLMAALPNKGIMVSIMASEEDVTKAVSRYKHEFPGSAAAIAAVNSQSSVVVSGTPEVVTAIANELAGLGHRVTPLRYVSHAFHSPMMDPILADLENVLESSLKSRGKLLIPLVSTVTGRRAEAAVLRSATHWTRHVSQTVRFADAVSELRKEGVSVFMEVGPSAILSPHVPGAIATNSQVNKLLSALGQLWIRGVQADWRAVFEGSNAQIVDLPVYSFQRRRYWLDPPKPAAAQPEDKGTLGHGVLLHATSIPETRRIICSGYLSTVKQPWLRDHVVGGQIIVPAAVFTELALRASRECTGTKDLMILDEIVFLAPLALTSKTDGGYQIQVLIGEPQEHGTRSLDVYSRPDGVATQHEWTRHATGTLKLPQLPTIGGGKCTNGTYPTSNGTTHLDHEAMMDVSNAYAALTGAGISYGPSFRRVSAVWRPDADGQGQNELRAYIDLPESQGQEGQMFALHPALLDAALHASLLASPERAVGNVCLPFSLRGVELSTAVSSGPLMARIRELGENRFSVALTDRSTGALVAEVSEVVTRAWTGPVSPAGPAMGDLYRLEWTEAARTKPGGGPAEASRNSDEIFRVRGHQNFDTAGEKRLVEEAVHIAVAEVLGVIQKWSANNAYAAGSRLVIVTEKASIDTHPNFVAAAVWGLVRSAQAEFSRNRIVLVDLDGSAKSEEALLSALASLEEAFAVREGRIAVPGLKKVNLVSPLASTPPEPSTSTSTLDVSGTVLITGGTGGLGALLSRHIVRAYKAKSLLLISRSGMKAPGAHQLYDDLSSANAAVRIEECDCSDRAQLAELPTRNTAEGHPPITAIIHCAGVLDDALLSSQTPQRISSVLRPKVDGAWNLHELAPATVRSFVMFSSFVGILGNEGQAGYSAGNSFLDALARFRVARGLPALSLAWGPWLNEVGMAAQGRLKTHNPRLSSAKPLTDQQGLQLFDTALRKSTPWEPVMAPMIIEGPLPLISSGMASEAKRSRADGGSIWRKKFAVLAPERRGDVLLSLVRDEVAAVLGYQDQGLPERPLAELGFDSSTSVLLSNRLRRMTGLSDLPITLALDYDTLPALVEYLAGRLEVGRPEAQPEAEPGMEVPSTADNIGEGSQGLASADRNKSNGSSMPRLAGADPKPERGHETVDLEMFRGLTALYKQLSKLGTYTAAADLLGCASLALPTFNAGSDLESYAAAPQRLATGPTRCSGSPSPIVFLPSFTPAIVVEGFRGSMYSVLAAEMKGDRDIFELPHPGGLAVPEDLETLASVHASTIRAHFAGPIILAGYSAGGIVAHAVASKLSEDPEDEQVHKAQVAGLVLIDTYINMSGRDDPDWLNALPAETLTTRGGSLLHMVGDSDLALAKMGGYFRTLRDLKLRPLAAALPTLFLRAQDPSIHVPEDGDEWRPSWPRADVTVDVPGSHLELLEKRYAHASAAEIRRWAKQYADGVRTE
ncbi:Type I Modular PKS [Diaporthe australafricana]|uniref:Type I Modular PKS n=1 Tax=Diaporthe australafricana TaxID=127596 RepID=A0ABR3W8L6_9PEZI